MRSYTITTWHPTHGTRTGKGNYRNITSARIDAAKEAANTGACVDEITCEEDGTGWPFAIYPAEPTDAAAMLRQMHPPTTAAPRKRSGYAATAPGRWKP